MQGLRKGKTSRKTFFSFYESENSDDACDEIFVEKFFTGFPSRFTAARLTRDKFCENLCACFATEVQAVWPL
jgi:hypothetical protein